MFFQFVFTNSSGVVEVYTPAIIGVKASPTINWPSDILKLNFSLFIGWDRTKLSLIANDSTSKNADRARNIAYLRVSPSSIVPTLMHSIIQAMMMTIPANQCTK